MVFVFKFFRTFSEVNEITQCYGFHVSRATNKFHPKQLFDIVMVAHFCGLPCVGPTGGICEVPVGYTVYWASFTAKFPLCCMFIFVVWNLS